MERVIVDGDWGGDEMQLAAVLLAHPERISMLGATAVFGNAAHDQVLRNAGDILSLLNAEDVRYYPGAEGPSGHEVLPGDDAHGADGVGGVILPHTSAKPERKNATEYILETLAEEPKGTVSITATGPLTNLAQAYVRSPEVMRRVKQIVVMGGCTEPIPARDMVERRGNITPEAEFNFYMAPQDTQDVMASGLPITLLPMNCTQQLTLTAVRENRLYEALSEHPGERDIVLDLMKAPAVLDETKFGSAPIMHDVNTALYLVEPSLYTSALTGTVAITVNGESQGNSAFTRNGGGNVRVMHKVHDDAAFDIVLKSIKRCLTR